MRLATLPGLSGSFTVNLASLPSAAKPRSRQRPRTVVSMLPPHRTTTTLEKGRQIQGGNSHYIDGLKGHVNIRHEHAHVIVMSPGDEAIKFTCVLFYFLHRVAIQSLPPQANVLESHFFPASVSSSCPERHAASPVAPAPSTTDFSTSTSRSMARAMSSSFTIHTLSTQPLAVANALPPT